MNIDTLKAQLAQLHTENPALFAEIKKFMASIEIISAKG